MKAKMIGLFVFITTSYSLMAQTWTADQLAKANTAKNVPVISTIEKETIMYLNLARLYPKEFCKYEIVNYHEYENSTYKKTLMNKLNTMKPAGVLYFYEPYYKTAKCLADEQAVNGNISHERTKCTNFAGSAECIEYGSTLGKDIAINWLIDDGVESLGHRETCLNPAYTKVGLSFGPHPTTYRHCTVADFG